MPLVSPKTMTATEQAAYDRMMAKLSRHRQPQPIEAAPPPPESKAQLQWEKPGKGATGVYTTCKRYACCKVVTTYRSTTMTTYEVWRLVPQLWFTQIAIGLSSFEEAKSRAQSDFESRL